MNKSFFIGVDGGATKCKVRVEDQAGNLLGQDISGPANIRISAKQAWQSITIALEKILSPLDITLDDKRYHFHAGMGLAGCELPSACEAFLNQPHSLQTLIISSDAHTACLGAHAGKDGAVIIIGTGVVGFQVELGQTTKVGGWGFPHDDQGGGAWLGLQAVKTTLQTLDRRKPKSEFADFIFAQFKQDLNHFITWANEANSTAFAELAPLVIKQACDGNMIAIEIMQNAANAIQEIAGALQIVESNPELPLPYSLLGGIAPFIEPYLGNKLRTRITPWQFSPEIGAIYLARDYLTSAETGIHSVIKNYSSKNLS